MKNFEIMARPPARAAPAAGALPAVCSCGSTFWPGMARSMPGDHHAVVRRQPLLDHAQVADQRADLDLALLDDIVLVDDQHVAAALVAAERDVGHQQRGLLRSEPGTRTRTK